MRKVRPSDGLGVDSLSLCVGQVQRTDAFISGLGHDFQGDMVPLAKRQTVIALSTVRLNFLFQEAPCAFRKLVIAV